MKFSYQKFPRDPNPAFPDTKWVSRPVIPVELVDKESKPFGYKVLIDSGADHNMFHAEVGELLGLDVRKGKPLEFFGVTGDKQRAYFHRVELKVGGYLCPIYCGFVYEWKNLAYGILGQDDFFRLYSVKFNLPKGVVELGEN